MTALPKAGDLVSFYDFDIGELATGVVLLVGNYNYMPSQDSLEVPSAWILSDATTHIVPIKGEFWQVEVLSETDSRRSSTIR